MSTSKSKIWRLWLLTIYKKNPEILLGNFWSVRTVRVVYQSPKISGLWCQATLNSSYNMKLVRNSRNLYRNVPFGKRDYLFRISVSPGNFPVGRAKKTFTIYIPTGISGNFVVNGKQLFSSASPPPEYQRPTPSPRP